jgi:uncharacterized lipoprotein NlpE involved in copper resistance
MKKTVSIFFAIAFVLGMTGTSAFAHAPKVLPAPVDAAHGSRNSLNWDGVYAGTIPSASGSGIEVTITLRQDSTYVLRYHYVGRQGSGDFTTAGTFEWDEAGGVITLDARDIPPHYRVGENRLIQLDMAGQPITGMLADDYVLEKQPEQEASPCVRPAP